MKVGVGQAWSKILGNIPKWCKLINFDGLPKGMYGWKWLPVEYEHHFDWGLNSVENNLQIENGLMKNKHQWKSFFQGRRPVLNDCLQWNIIFNEWWWRLTSGRRPWIEKDLQRKKIFKRRRPSKEEDLPWKKNFNEIKLSGEENSQ